MHISISTMAIYIFLFYNNDQRLFNNIEIFFLNVGNVLNANLKFMSFQTAYLHAFIILTL